MVKKIAITAFLLLSLSCAAFAGTIQLPRTGQATCYDSSGAVIGCAGTGQDGDMRAGAAWPNPRFTANGDCVTDNLTGLVWARDGNLAGARTWQGALDWIAAFNSGSGLCGQHDWRLPNRKELQSLVDRDRYNPALPGGHPFINVQSFDY